MAERIDRDELRLLIREALKEALGTPSPPRGERVAGPQDRLGEGGSARSRAVSPSPSRFAATPSPQGGGEYRVTSGVLTEAAVAEIGKSHRKLVLGPAVVVTPLARDKAREMKLEIERQKP